MKITKSIATTILKEMKVSETIELRHKDGSAVSIEKTTPKEFHTTTDNDKNLSTLKRMEGCTDFFAIRGETIKNLNWNRTYDMDESPLAIADKILTKEKMSKIEIEYEHPNHLSPRSDFKEPDNPYFRMDHYEVAKKTRRWERENFIGLYRELLSKLGLKFKIYESGNKMVDFWYLGQKATITLHRQAAIIIDYWNVAVLEAHNKNIERSVRWSGYNFYDNVFQFILNVNKFLETELEAGEKQFVHKSTYLLDSLNDGRFHSKEEIEGKLEEELPKGKRDTLLALGVKNIHLGYQEYRESGVFKFQGTNYHFYYDIETGTVKSLPDRADSVSMNDIHVIFEDEYGREFVSKEGCKNRNPVKYELAAHALG